MSHVAIVGSGNVGANTAFFIAEKGITDVKLYDIREGLAAGKVLDMMEAAPVRRYRNRLIAVGALEEIAGAQVVVVAAGGVRKPGMRREDLFCENAPLIQELGPKIARLCPEATVILVTEPIDLVTALFQKISGIDPKRVIGLGGVLDSARLRFAIARELGVSQEDVTAMVIGRHSKEMMALPRYCTVSGMPVTKLIPSDRMQALVEETREAGDLIVSLAQRSSAYYAPSAAAAEVVDSLHMDLRRIFSVSVVLNGEYGVRGVALNLPCVIGRGGIERVLTPELQAPELELFQYSAGALEVTLQEWTK